MEKIIRTVGTSIRAARKAAGISLATLSAATGISKGHLSQIENGRVGSPTGSILALIAGALGTNVDSLIGVDSDLSVDASLAQAVRECGWSYGTARMLAAVSIDGLKPESADDYRALYEAIRNTLRDRQEDGMGRSNTTRREGEG